MADATSGGILLFSLFPMARLAFQIEVVCLIALVADAVPTRSAMGHIIFCLLKGLAQGIATFKALALLCLP